MCDDAVFQFKSCIRSVFRGAAIGFAIFIPALREMCGSDTGDAFDGTEEVVNDVSPVAEHIEDNAAAVFGTVVPRWSLGGDGIALEDPITEFTADSDNLSEEISIYQTFEFLDAG